MLSVVACAGKLEAAEQATAELRQQVEASKAAEAAAKAEVQQVQQQLQKERDEQVGVYACSSSCAIDLLCFLASCFVQSDGCSQAGGS